MEIGEEVLFRTDFPLRQCGRHGQIAIIKVRYFGKMLPIHHFNRVGGCRYHAELAKILEDTIDVDH